MEDYTKQFGLCVRRYRKQKKMSQEKLAELCDLHPVYIGQLERGEKNASLESIMHICKGLDISPSFLFEELERSANDTPAQKAYELFMELPQEKQEILLELLRKAVELI